MNRFGLLLADELEREGIDLEDLPDLLLGAGADDYDVATLDATLGTATTGGLDAIGWHPDTWRALREVLDDAPKDRMLPLLKAFYLIGVDEAPAA